MLPRRLAREYDHRLGNAAARVYWASIANMARRLTAPAPAWCDDFVAALDAALAETEARLAKLVTTRKSSLNSPRPGLNPNRPS